MCVHIVHTQLPCFSVITMLLEDEAFGRGAPQGNGMSASVKEAPRISALFKDLGNIFYILTYFCKRFGSKEVKTYHQHHSLKSQLEVTVGRTGPLSGMRFLL